MNYKTVDLKSWERAELFTFYIERMRIVKSLTADIDVTPLVSFAKERGLKFYPAMIWVVSKAVNSRDEFKYGWDAAGNLIKWDCISPSYADFHTRTRNSRSWSRSTAATFLSSTSASNATGRDTKTCATLQRPSRKPLRRLLPAVAAVQEL